MRDTDDLADLFQKEVQLAKAELSEKVAAKFRGTAWMAVAGMLGLLALLLLIACVNLSGLMVARAAARRHETSIRAALGASRWQVVRPELMEIFLLTGGGGALGLIYSLIR